MCIRDRLMGTPFFLVFGGLSDKIGRKKIMLAGMLIAVFAYRPIYEKMYQTVNLKNKTEIVTNTTITQQLKAIKKNAGYDSVITTGKFYEEGTHINEIKTITLENGVGKMVDGKAKVDIKKTVTINDSDKWMLVFLVFIQVIFVTMVYGPIAAFLVELFPTKIRYTSMSLPYHIGNGVFGGLLPAVATYLASKAKDANTVAEKANEALPFDKPYLEGLWYPIIVTGVCFIIGLSLIHI